MKKYALTLLVLVIPILSTVPSSLLNAQDLRDLYQRTLETREKYVQALAAQQSGQGTISSAEMAFQEYLRAKREYEQATRGVGPTSTTSSEASVLNNTRLGNLFAKARQRVKAVFDTLFSPGGGQGPVYFKEEIFATVTAYQGLNVRNMPTTEGKALTVLPHGATVKVLGRQGDWIIVSFNGLTGYAHGSYLQRVAKPGEKTADPMADPYKADPPPVVANPIQYPTGSVNTHDQDFPQWIDFAKSEAARFNEFFPPNLKNKYGQAITKDMAIKCVLYNESRGVHATQAGGVIVNPWGFTGWMQISKTVAEETLGENAGLWKEARWNLVAGTKYMGTCLRSASPPPADWKIYREGDSDQDRLLKGIVGYNRGPYHNRLKQSWDEVVKSTQPNGSDYMAEGVQYGIQAKMGMGLELTRAEKDWMIARVPTINNDADVEKRALQIYAYVQHM